MNRTQTALAVGIDALERQRVFAQDPTSGEYTVDLTPKHIKAALSALRAELAAAAPLGRVAESIFDNGRVVIPMARVSHVERHGPEQQYAHVVMDCSTWHTEIDAYHNSVQLSLVEIQPFLSAWCRYRSELEAATLAALGSSAEELQRAEHAMTDAYRGQPQEEQPAPQAPMTFEALLGAIARGYGHKANSKKEVDSALAVSIAKEIMALQTRPAITLLTDAQVRQINQDLGVEVHEDTDSWALALAHVVVAEFCRVNGLKVQA